MLGWVCLIDLTTNNNAKEIKGRLCLCTPPLFRSRLVISHILCAFSRYVSHIWKLCSVRARNSSWKLGRGRTCPWTSTWIGLGGGWGIDCRLHQRPDCISYFRMADWSTCARWAAGYAVLTASLTAYPSLWSASISHHSTCAPDLTIGCRLGK